ncbi:MAG: GntR family transcriptional regulator [Spirochaetaceae bacterium]|jgi:GntR family transcriptional regulator|nr:GntR family transcriptional regulator [Spirochaetaceae bacterium]
MSRTTTQGSITFSLDQSNGVPIYRQIIQQVEYAILSGQMKSGDKLPTIRSLAVELKINPNTIVKAYGELEIRGILMTQVGTGTFIANQGMKPEEETRRKKVQEIANRFLQDMQGLGVKREELFELFDAYPLRKEE